MIKQIRFSIWMTFYKSGSLQKAGIRELNDRCLVNGDLISIQAWTQNHIKTFFFSNTLKVCSGFSEGECGETVCLSVCVWIKQPAARQEVEYEGALMNPVIEQWCSVNSQTVLVMQIRLICVFHFPVHFWGNSWTCIICLELGVGKHDEGRHHVVRSGDTQ